MVVLPSTTRLGKLWRELLMIGAAGLMIRGICMTSSGKKNITTKSHHAEILSFFRVPKRFRHRISLLVIRIGPNGRLKCSKPRENCTRFFSTQRIKSVTKGLMVYYSTEEETIQKIKFNITVLRLRNSSAMN